MASMLTSAPLRSSISKSVGMAVISLLLPSTATWPNVRLASVAQALTRCNAPNFDPAEPAGAPQMPRSRPLQIVHLAEQLRLQPKPSDRASHHRPSTSPVRQHGRQAVPVVSAKARA